MDTNNNQIINYLLSTANDGDIADDFREEIEEMMVAILEDEEVTEALGQGITAFVDAIVPMALAALGLSEEDARILAEILGTAYGTGLAFGVSIGTLAEQAAEG